jgi:hypothetical protein
LRSLGVNLELNGIRNRVVLSDHLQKTAILRSPLVDHHYPVIRALFRPDPGETYCYQKETSLHGRETEELYQIFSRGAA